MMVFGDGREKTKRMKRLEGQSDPGEIGDMGEGW
jgi:hypothetical protein